MNYGINFGHNRKWSAHSDAGLMEEAKNVALPSLMRINSLAKSRVNRNGHAEFGPGEIASVLIIVDKKTGETKSMSKAQVANLIKQGKESGLFDEESSSRCIVICSRVVQRNTGTGSCKHHNINKSGNQIIQETEEAEKASNGAEVHEDQNNNPTSENKTVDQDEAVSTVFTAPEPTENDCELTGHVKVIIGQSNNPELAEVYYRDVEFAPDDDEFKRAAKARSEADYDEHRFVMGYEDFDEETLVEYILRMKRDELINA